MRLFTLRKPLCFFLSASQNTVSYFINILTDILKNVSEAELGDIILIIEKEKLS